MDIGSGELVTVDDLDMSTVGGAQLAIGVVDAAIKYVDSHRSEIGGFQNRVSGTIDNLNTINRVFRNQRANSRYRLCSGVDSNGALSGAAGCDNCITRSSEAKAELCTRLAQLNVFQRCASARKIQIIKTLPLAAFFRARISKNYLVTRRTGVSPTVTEPESLFSSLISSMLEITTELVLTSAFF